MTVTTTSLSQVLDSRHNDGLDVFDHPYADAAFLGIELPVEPALAA